MDVPEGLDLILAAALPLVTVTGNQLLSATGITKGQTVMVMGAIGNVGRSALFTAKDRGAIVIAGVLKRQVEEAKTLGAEVITIRADNISEALVTFAVNHHVRHAVFGKSRRTPLMELVKGSVLLNFIHDSVGIDVHIVTTTGESLNDIAPQS